MAILSVSRRTDIPTYFGEWFLKRIEEGKAAYRNPVNENMVTELALDPKTIDCIVFWTKNPIPMMNRGMYERLRGYNYYFQFTITGYADDVEGNLPSKGVLLKAFRDLSKHCKVIWRYDPILFTPKYTMEYHTAVFEKIASTLEGFTDKVVISYIDTNMNIMKAMNNAKVYHANPTDMQVLELSKRLAEIAHKHGMSIASCAEMYDLSQYGIEHNSCIDKDVIEQVCGYPIAVSRCKGLRTECRCVENIDIGKYDTCMNDCCYCYACKDKSKRAENMAIYNPYSIMLCDEYKPTDDVRIKTLESFRCEPQPEQMSLF